MPSPNHPRVAALLPNRAGVGLKPEHIDAILAERPDVGFFEIHAENYMGDGGPPHRRLEAIRSLYPAVPARRRPVDRLAATARQSASGASGRACEALRAGAVLGASGVVEP